MEVVYRCCAGIDVSKGDAKVCIRVQGRGSAKTTMTVSTWSSVMPQILRLRDQLVADGVELAVVGSTSDYWRPFFYVHSVAMARSTTGSEALPVMLVKASDVKGMPGRKSDVSDRGVAGRPGRARDLTRARVGLFQERTRELRRLEK